MSDIPGVYGGSSSSQSVEDWLAKYVEPAMLRLGKMSTAKLILHKKWTNWRVFFSMTHSPNILLVVSVAAGRY